jgi:hypothetical protein
MTQADKQFAGVPTSPNRRGHEKLLEDIWPRPNTKQHEFAGVPTSPYVHYEVDHGRGFVPVADRASSQAEAHYREFWRAKRGTLAFPAGKNGEVHRMGRQVNGPHGIGAHIRKLVSHNEAGDGAD